MPAPERNAPALRIAPTPDPLDEPIRFDPREYPAARPPARRAAPEPPAYSFGPPATEDPLSESVDDMLEPRDDWPGPPTLREIADDALRATGELIVALDRQQLNRARSIALDLRALATALDVIEF